MIITLSFLFRSNILDFLSPQQNDLFYTNSSRPLRLEQYCFQLNSILLPSKISMGGRFRTEKKSSNFDDQKSELWSKEHLVIKNKQMKSGDRLT